MKQDWSYKPDIHSNEPVVEIGIVHKYKFDKKPSRKVHEINPDTGMAYCKVENGTGRKLVTSENFPEGRAPCSMCTRLKAEPEPSKAKKRKQKKGKFYGSQEWAVLRYKAFLKYGNRCVVCGRSESLTVDHVKPIGKYPELSLDIDNLQVMCRLCNRGKGGWDETDWREK